MRWIIAALVFAASAFGAHYFTVRAIPGFIMTKVQSTFEAQGLPLNRFIASPRQTPETQRVVRPSPDLSYVVCRFDVRNGPVVISAPAWNGYGSLSIFDDQTNNIFVASLDGQPASVVLHAPDTREEDMAKAASISPTVEIDGAGIALIRRLAPTDARHKIAVELVAEAQCGKAR